MAKILFKHLRRDIVHEINLLIELILHSEWIHLYHKQHKNHSGVRMLQKQLDKNIINNRHLKQVQKLTNL